MMREKSIKIKTEKYVFLQNIYNNIRKITFFQIKSAKMWPKSAPARQRGMMTDKSIKQIKQNTTSFS